MRSSRSLIRNLRRPSQSFCGRSLSAVLATRDFGSSEHSRARNDLQDLASMFHTTYSSTPLRYLLRVRSHLSSINTAHLGRTAELSSDISALIFTANSALTMITSTIRDTAAPQRVTAAVCALLLVDAIEPFTQTTGLISARDSLAMEASTTIAGWLFAPANPGNPSSAPPEWVVSVIVSRLASPYPEPVHTPPTAAAAVRALRSGAAAILDASVSCVPADGYASSWRLVVAAVRWVAAAFTSAPPHDALSTPDPYAATTAAATCAAQGWYGSPPLQTAVIASGAPSAPAALVAALLCDGAWRRAAALPPLSSETPASHEPTLPPHATSLVLRILSDGAPHAVRSSVAALAALAVEAAVLRAAIAPAPRAPSPPCVPPPPSAPPSSAPRASLPAPFGSTPAPVSTPLPPPSPPSPTGRHMHLHPLTVVGPSSERGGDYGATMAPRAPLRAEAALSTVHVTPASTSSDAPPPLRAHGDAPGDTGPDAAPDIPTATSDGVAPPRAASTFPAASPPSSHAPPCPPHVLPSVAAHSALRTAGLSSRGDALTAACCAAARAVSGAYTLAAAVAAASACAARAEAISAATAASASAAAAAAAAAADKTAAATTPSSSQVPDAASVAAATAAVERTVALHEAVVGLVVAALPTIPPAALADWLDIFDAGTPPLLLSYEHDLVAGDLHAGGDNAGAARADGAGPMALLSALVRSATAASRAVRDAATVGVYCSPPGDAPLCASGVAVAFLFAPRLVSAMRGFVAAAAVAAAAVREVLPHDIHTGSIALRAPSQLCGTNADATTPTNLASRFAVVAFAPIVASAACLTQWGMPSAATLLHVRTDEEAGADVPVLRAAAAAWAATRSVGRAVGPLVQQSVLLRIGVVDPAPSDVSEPSPSADNPVRARGAEIHPATVAGELGARITAAAVAAVRICGPSARTARTARDLGIIAVARGIGGLPPSVRVGVSSALALAAASTAGASADLTNAATVALRETITSLAACAVVQAVSCGARFRLVDAATRSVGATVPTPRPGAAGAAAAPPPPPFGLTLGQADAAQPAAPAPAPQRDEGRAAPTGDGAVTVASDDALPAAPLARVPVGMARIVAAAEAVVRVAIDHAATELPDESVAARSAAQTRHSNAPPPPSFGGGAFPSPIYPTASASPLAAPVGALVYAVCVYAAAHIGPAVDAALRADEAARLGWSAGPHRHAATAAFPSSSVVAVVHIAARTAAVAAAAQRVPGALGAPLWSVSIPHPTLQTIASAPEAVDALLVAAAAAHRATAAARSDPVLSTAAAAACSTWLADALRAARRGTDTAAAAELLVGCVAACAPRDDGTTATATWWADVSAVLRAVRSVAGMLAPGDCNAMATAVAPLSRSIPAAHAALPDGPARSAAQLVVRITPALLRALHPPLDRDADVAPAREAAQWSTAPLAAATAAPPTASWTPLPSDSFLAPRPLSSSPPQQVQAAAVHVPRISQQELLSRIKASMATAAATEAAAAEAAKAAAAAATEAATAAAAHDARVGAQALRDSIIAARAAASPPPAYSGRSQRSNTRIESLVWTASGVPTAAEETVVGASTGDGASSAGFWPHTGTWLMATHRAPE